MSERWVLASSNQGKLAELQGKLEAKSLDVTLIPQTELGVTDADETGLSFVENAILKARHAAQATGLPALADDSGLCIDALDGAPGLYSARYAGTHGDFAANIQKVLAEMAQLPADTPRTARFVCVLAWVRSATDALPQIFTGFWEGDILTAPRGEKGFGYDPIFYDPIHKLSAAEMDPELKNAVSHRAHALAHFAIVTRGN